MMQRCQRCPAMIQFVRMVKKDGTIGKEAPIEADPSERGNVRVAVLADQSLQGRVLAGMELERAHENGEALYLNHFATCPRANEFRPAAIAARRAAAR
jgi:hypothetical protein